MKTKLKGLLCEPLPSGNKRYRVRVKGNHRKRITLSVTPEDPDFLTHYNLAREGKKVESEPVELDTPHTIGWLFNKYLKWMKDQADNGTFSAKTLKKRTNILGKILRDFDLADYHVNITRPVLIRLQDAMSATPSTADDTITAIRVVYDWAIDRGYCEVNPASRIKNFGRKGNGSTPWTRADFSTFTDTHKPGSTAYLCLHLLAFTACRIGDARLLGRRNETMRDGVKFLEWQPEKKGAAFVSVPMMPQLQDAIRRCGNQETYLRNSWDKPFSSGDALSQVFSKWCKQAGMENRTAHGVRKAVGHLLAEAGCSQYQIMAIHGHTESRTSEVYTVGVQRRKLAIQAMQSMESFEL